MTFQEDNLKQMENTIIKADCFEFMEQCPIQYFDAIITDPPYEVDLEAKNDALNQMKGKGRDYQDENLKGFSAEDTERLARMCWKVLKDNTYCISFCGDDQSFSLRKAFCRVGFRFHQFLVWEKNNSCLSLSPYRTRLNHELIMVFTKGMPFRLNKSCFGRPSVLQFDIPKVKDRYHPTQKPHDLMCHLVKLYSKDGDLIFDPFAGSGSTLKASMHEGRKCITTELVTDYIDGANNDVENRQGQQKLSF